MKLSVETKVDPYQLSKSKSKFFEEKQNSNDYFEKDLLKQLNKSKLEYIKQKKKNRIEVHHQSYLANLKKQLNMVNNFIIMFSFSQLMFYNTDNLSKFNLLLIVLKIPIKAFNVLYQIILIQLKQEVILNTFDTQQPFLKEIKQSNFQRSKASQIVSKQKQPWYYTNKTPENFERGIKIYQFSKQDDNLAEKVKQSNSQSPKPFRPVSTKADYFKKNEIDKFHVCLPSPQIHNTTHLRQYFYKPQLNQTARCSSSHEKLEQLQIMKPFTTGTKRQDYFSSQYKEYQQDLLT